MLWKEGKVMADKNKLSLKDYIQAIAGGVIGMGGLFAFCLILGVIFMDYDPMTMVENIMQDLKAIFG